MAFTKITAAGIGSTETVTLDGLSVINNGSFGGNLTVSGVLTYEDVTNVDSVGLITARNGIVVGSGITLSKDGDGFYTGVVTATTFSGNFTGGTITGDGSALTGVASTENIRTNTNATFLQNVSIVGTSTVTGNIVPSSDSATDIGTNSVRFQNAYVDTYYGDGSNLTGISAGLSNVVEDTTPQLGGDLDTNTKNIKLGDSGTAGASGDDTLIFGADDDMRMYHDGANGYISNNTGAFVVQDSHAGANAIIVRKGAEVELMHNNVLACETSANGLAFPSGKGIDFSADANATNMTGEVLDDYERGSWTPGSNTGTVGVAANGEYVKIGRFVQLSVLLYNFSDTSTATSVLITGVPFSANTGGQYVGQVWLRRTTTGNKNYNCVIGDSAVNKINFKHDSDGNSMGGDLQHSDFAHSTPYLNLTISYQSF